MIASALMLAVLQGVSGTLPAATAAAGTVIAVILPDSPDASMLEALSRLRGEADSVGLELRLVQAEPGVDTDGQLGRVAQQLTPAAVVALVAAPRLEPAPAPAVIPLRAMDVWFLDPATGETSVGHVLVEPEAGPRADLVLAVRVVDFIRARMFDSLVRSRAAARIRPAPVSYLPEGRRYLAAGLAATGSWSGFDTAFLPALELGYAWRPWLRTTLGLAGWGSKPRGESPDIGGVAMAQTMIKASAVFLGPSWWRLLPSVELGGTAYFLSVDGIGYSGYVGDAPSSWSPGLHGAAGLGLVLSRHLVAQLSAGALVLARRPRLFVTETEVASTGRPAWTAQASLGAVF